MQRKTPKPSKFLPLKPVITCSACAIQINLDHGFACCKEKYMCLPCYFK